MSDPRSDPARDASGTFAQLHTLASARLEAARTMRLMNSLPCSVCNKPVS